MRNRRTARLAALLVLSSWVVPVAVTLGVGLHLVIDPHHRDERASGLALAAVHGHAHELGHTHEFAEPEHEHDARLADAPRTPLRPVSTPAAVPGDVAAFPEVTPAAGYASTARPPPLSLFTAHCALLL